MTELSAESKFTFLDTLLWLANTLARAACPTSAVASACTGKGLVLKGILLSHCRGVDWKGANGWLIWLRRHCPWMVTRVHSLLNGTNGAGVDQSISGRRGRHWTPARRLLWCWSYRKGLGGDQCRADGKGGRGRKSRRDMHGHSVLWHRNHWRSNRGTGTGAVGRACGICRRTVISGIRTTGGALQGSSTGDQCATVKSHEIFVFFVSGSPLGWTGDGVLCPMAALSEWLKTS